MTRTQWLNHLRTIDRLREKGLLNNEGRLKCIDTLIDAEREEWDKIDMENMGLIPKKETKKNDN